MMQSVSSSLSIAPHSVQNGKAGKPHKTLDTLEDVRLALIKSNKISQDGKLIYHPDHLPEVSEKGLQRFWNLLNLSFISKTKEGKLLAEFTLSSLCGKMTAAALLRQVNLSRFFLSSEAVFKVLGAEFFVEILSSCGYLMTDRLKAEIQSRCDKCKHATLMIEESTLDSKNIAREEENILLASLKTSTFSEYEIHQTGFASKPKVTPHSYEVTLSDRTACNLTVHFSKNLAFTETFTKEKARLQFPQGHSRNLILNNDRQTMLQASFDWLFETNRIDDPTTINHLTFPRLLSNRTNGETVEFEIERECLRTLKRTASNGLTKSILGLLLEVWERYHFKQPVAFPYLFLNGYPLLKEQEEFQSIVDEIQKHAKLPADSLLQIFFPLLRSQKDYETFFLLCECLHRIGAIPPTFDGCHLRRLSYSTDPFLLLRTQERSQLAKFDPFVRSATGKKMGFDDLLAAITTEQLFEKQKTSLLQRLQEGVRISHRELEEALTSLPFESAALIVQTMKDRKIPKVNQYVDSLVMRDDRGLAQSWQFWRQFHPLSSQLSKESFPYLLKIIGMLKVTFIPSIAEDLKAFAKQDGEVEQRLNELLGKEEVSSTSSGVELLQSLMQHCKDLLATQQIEQALASLENVNLDEKTKGEMASLLLAAIQRLRADATPQKLSQASLLFKDKRVEKWLGANLSSEISQFFKAVLKGFREQPVIYKSVVFDYLPLILSNPPDDLMEVLTDLLPYRDEMPTTCRERLKEHAETLLSRYRGLDCILFTSRLHFFDALPEDRVQMRSALTNNWREASIGANVVEANRCCLALSNIGLLDCSDPASLLKWAKIVVTHEVDLNDWMSKLKDSVLNDEAKTLLRQLFFLCLERESPSLGEIYRNFQHEIDQELLLIDLIEATEVPAEDKKRWLAHYSLLVNGPDGDLLRQLPVNLSLRIARKMRENGLLPPTLAPFQVAIDRLDAASMIDSWGSWKETTPLNAQLDDEQKKYVLKMLVLLKANFNPSIAEEAVSFKGQDPKIDAALKEISPALRTHYEKGLTPSRAVEVLNREIFTLYTSDELLEIKCKVMNDCFQKKQFKEGLAVLGQLVCTPEQTLRVRATLRETLKACRTSREGLSQGHQLLTDDRVIKVLGDQDYQDELSDFLSVLARALNDPTQYKSLAFDFLLLTLTSSSSSAALIVIIQSLWQFRNEMPDTLKNALRQSEESLYRSRRGLERLRLVRVIQSYEFSPVNAVAIEQLIHEAWDEVSQSKDKESCEETHTCLTQFKGGRLTLTGRDPNRTVRLLHWIELLLQLDLMAHAESLIPKLKDAAWNEESKQLLNRIVESAMSQAQLSVVLSILEACKDQVDSESVIRRLLNRKELKAQTKVKILNVMRTANFSDPELWEKGMLLSDQEPQLEVHHAAASLLIHKIERDHLLDAHPARRQRVWLVALATASHRLIDCLTALPPFATFCDSEGLSFVYDLLLPVALQAPREAAIQPSITAIRENVGHIPFAKRMSYVHYLLDVKTSPALLLALGEYLDLIVMGYSPSEKKVLEKSVKEWMDLFKHVKPEDLSKRRIAQREATYLDEITQLLQHAKENGFSGLTLERCVTFYGYHPIPVLNAKGLSLLTEKKKESVDLVQSEDFPKVKRLFESVGTAYTTENASTAFAGLKAMSSPDLVVVRSQLIEALILSVLNYASKTDSKEEVIAICDACIEALEGLHFRDLKGEKTLVDRIQDVLPLLLFKFNDKTQFSLIHSTLQLRLFHRACNRTPSKAYTPKKVKELIDETCRKLSENPDQFYFLPFESFTDPKESKRLLAVTLHILEKVFDYPSQTVRAKEFKSGFLAPIKELATYLSNPKSALYRDAKEKIVQLVDKYVDLWEPDETQDFDRYYARSKELTQHVVKHFSTGENDEFVKHYVRWSQRCYFKFLTCDLRSVDVLLRIPQVPTQSFYLVAEQSTMADDLLKGWLEKKKPYLFRRACDFIETLQQQLSPALSIVVEPHYRLIFDELENLGFCLHNNTPNFHYLQGTIFKYLGLPIPFEAKERLCTAFFHRLYALKDRNAAKLFNIPLCLAIFLKDAMQKNGFGSNIVSYLKLVETLLEEPYEENLYKNIGELLTTSLNNRELLLPESIYRADLQQRLQIRRREYY